LPSLAKVKEKALMALSVRKLIERGWLTALLGYLIKREELSVRLKYIGDVRLRRTTFGAEVYRRCKVTKDNLWGLGNNYVLCLQVLAKVT